MKVRTLQVRPSKSVELSLPIGGVLSPPPGTNLETIKPGVRANKCDLQTLMMEKMKDLNWDPSKSAEHPLGSNAILELTKDKLIATLRTEKNRNDLDRAITDRARQYLERYMHIDQYVDAYSSAYLSLETKGSAGNKSLGNRWGVLDSLRQVVTDRYEKINKAYEGSGPYRDVLQQTKSTNNVGEKEKQNLYGLEKFSHPRLDSNYDYLRNQLDLSAEIIEAMSQSIKARNMEGILKYELKSLDLQIENFRADFINTLLMSPFNGIVTQIYKNFGESVQPFEPILRVENWDSIYLIGWVQSRRVLKLGATVQVSTKDVFENASVPKSLVGEIISIRGHDSDNDEWELIIECDNTQLPQLPVNYRFDRESTDIDFA